MERIFKNVSQDYEAKTGVFVSPSIGQTERISIKSPLMYWADCNIFAAHEIPRDTFEREILQHVMALPVQIKLGRLQGSRSSGFNMTGMDMTCSRLNSLVKGFGVKASCHEHVGRKRSLSKHADIFLNTLKINLSHTLICSLVSFDRSRYTLNVIDTDIPPSISVTVDLNVTKLTFTKSSELNMLEVDEHGVLRVCHSLLDLKLSEMNSYGDILHSGGHMVDGTAYILKTATILTSMVCLLLTFKTHVQISLYRSPPGIYAMLLFTTLCLAEGSFLASSHL